MNRAFSSNFGLRNNDDINSDGFRDKLFSQLLKQQGTGEFNDLDPNYAKFGFGADGISGTNNIPQKQGWFSKLFGGKQTDGTVNPNYASNIANISGMAVDAGLGYLNWQEASKQLAFDRNMQKSDQRNDIAAYRANKRDLAEARMAAGGSASFDGEKTVEQVMAQDRLTTI